MYPVSLKIMLSMITFAVAVPSIIADTFPVSGLVVSGKVARLHRGQAAAPKKAPDAVKRAIWAANQLGSKPYRYGGATSRLKIGGMIVPAQSLMRSAQRA
jgi:hypothetical protein